MALDLLDSNPGQDKWMDAYTKINAAIDLLNILTPIGSIQPWSAISAPNVNYLVCDGSAVSRTTYAELFALISTNYGVGNGTTTFNLPNYKGRFLVGYDSGDGDYDSLPETGGERNHSLTESEMTAHFHSYNEAYIGGAGWVGGNAGAGNTYDLRSTNTGNVGSSAPHENRPPFVTVNYLIRAK